MNIEIVDFYESYRDPERIVGTLHVFLVDDKIDLRGVSVMKKKRKLFVRLPYRWTMENGKKVIYPIFNFLDAGKNKSLLLAVRKQGLKFIEKKLGGR